RQASRRAGGDRASLASSRLGAAKSGRKFPLLCARRVDRDVQDVEGRLGFLAFELDRVVGVSDDDVIDLLEQRRRSGPRVSAEPSRAQLVEVRGEDGCGVALNRELGSRSSDVAALV